MYSTWPAWTELEVGAGCRKDFVSGLWSIKPIRLHLADVGTNTSREESGYATSSNAHTPPSSSSSPNAKPGPRQTPAALSPPSYAPPPPPESAASSPPPSERLNAVDETTAAFNSFFERSAFLDDSADSGPRLPPPRGSRPPPDAASSSSSRRSRSRSQPPVAAVVRESVSVGGLYERLEYLSGLLADGVPDANLEGELEALYARLPLPSSPKVPLFLLVSRPLTAVSEFFQVRPPSQVGPITLRQKKSRSAAHRERRRSRYVFSVSR